MKSFQNELAKIKAEVQTHASTDYASEQEGIAESFRIREQLSSLLWEASRMLGTQEFLQLKSDVTSLFSKTIGCAEEEKSFLSVVKQLVGKGVLSDEDVSAVMQRSTAKLSR